MKIEPRGKYSGAKVHFDQEECAILLEGFDPEGRKRGLLRKLCGKLRKVFEENPDMLQERTEEEIRAELELELKKAQEKLALMDQGKSWKKS